VSRTVRSLLLGLIAAAVAGTAAAASIGAPLGQIAANCSIGTGRGYGYSYLTSLSVARTSCAVGRTVARHHGHVSGWKCTKKRLDTSPVQYDDRETCTSGRRLVRWTFTQNT
jgi:hypothetical protein